MHLHLAPALRTSHPHLHRVLSCVLILYVICDLNCSGLRDPRGSALIHSKSLQVLLRAFFWCSKQRSKNEGPRVRLGLKTELKCSENGPNIYKKSRSKSNSVLGWKFDLFVFRAGAREDPKSWFSYTNPWLELKTHFFDSIPFWLPFSGLKGSILSLLREKIQQKWTMKPGSKTFHVLPPVFIDFGTIFDFKMDDLFVPETLFFVPGSPFGPHFGPVGVIL